MAGGNVERGVIERNQVVEQEDENEVVKEAWIAD